jgi:hypothetical protein
MGGAEIESQFLLPRVVVWMDWQYRDSRGHISPIDKPGLTAPAIGTFEAAFNVRTTTVIPGKLLGEIRLLARRDLPDSPVLIHIHKPEARFTTAPGPELPKQTTDHEGHNYRCENVPYLKRFHTRCPLGSIGTTVGR